MMESSVCVPASTSEQIHRAYSYTLYIDTFSVCVKLGWNYLDVSSDLV